MMRSKRKSLKLSELNKGEQAIIIKVGGDNISKGKIFALGIFPGESVKLEQKFPVLLLKSGYSFIAMDEEVGKKIFVSRKND